MLFKNDFHGTEATAYPRPRATEQAPTKAPR